MYRLIYTIKGDSSHLLAHPYLKPLVVVAVLAVVLDDVHVIHVNRNCGCLPFIRTLRLSSI